MSNILGSIALFLENATNSGDSIGDANLRAHGIDPATAQPIPGYESTVGLSVNTSDPSAMAKYIADLNGQSALQYEQGFADAFNANGGFSILPFSPVIGGDANFFGSGNGWVVLLVVAGIILLLFFLLSAVK
jgi:hypothetical protein